MLTKYLNVCLFVLCMSVNRIFPSWLAYMYMPAVISVIINNENCSQKSVL